MQPKPGTADRQPQATQRSVAARPSEGPHGPALVDLAWAATPPVWPPHHPKRSRRRRPADSQRGLQSGTTAGACGVAYVPGRSLRNCRCAALNGDVRVWGPWRWRWCWPPPADEGYWVAWTDDVPATVGSVLEQLKARLRSRVALARPVTGAAGWSCFPGLVVDPTRS